MNVQLFPATTDDMPLLRDWMRQLRTADPMETEQIVPFAIAEESMRRLIDDASAGRVWIIRADTQATGYVALIFSFSIEFGGRTAFVDELFVAEQFRGKGMGGRAIELVTAAARDMGVQSLLLEVSDSNAAKALYERCGFVRRKYQLMSKWIGD